MYRCHINIYIYTRIYNCYYNWPLIDSATFLQGVAQRWKLLWSGSSPLSDFVSEAMRYRQKLGISPGQIGISWV